MTCHSLRRTELPAGTVFARPAPADALADGFWNPPASARPRVWWHWLDGNVTRDGIDRDLDWLARIGIGGVQHFDVALQTPQIVSKRLIYMSDAWKDAFRHALRAAASRGLEFAIASAPGWSETGGPWVQPQDAMKKLVWSETEVAGGQRVRGALPAPPSVAGPFQSVRPSAPLAAAAQLPDPDQPRCHGEVRVLTYPLAAAAVALPRPRVLDAAGRPLAGAAALDDADPNRVVQIATGDRIHPGALILDYGRPVGVRSARLFIPHARPPFGDPAYRPTLEAQTPQGWQPLGRFALTEVPSTLGFAPVTAQRFRLRLTPNDAARVPGLGTGAPGAIVIDVFGRPCRPTLGIGDLRLAAEARIDQFEVKAGYAIAPDYTGLGTGPADAPAIDPGQVLDLTERLRADGTLDWTAPGGTRWRIVRLGWSLTGKTNHPATPEATGLEVDKYDAAAVRRYLETYLAGYRAVVGADWIGARGIRALVTDSIEVGAANWTPRMIEEFRARRGYDPVPFLPTLTGAVVGSAARSDAFLHDYRQTLAELLAAAHYGTIAQVAHEHGLIVYGEALESGRPVLGDDLAMRAHADVPMAALWTFNRGSAPRPTLIGDIRGAASVAHIHGQNIVAAESMTSAFAPWAFAPADLKRVIDLEFVCGVNRPIIHTSVHQPVDDKVPGLSLGVFGQYFNRHESWAAMARPWIDYLARTGFLLQQGRNHADIACFYGEDAPLTALFEEGVPTDLPRGYAYDFVNAQILASQTSVQDGALIAGEARYKALYLGGSSQVMTLATLQRIAALVEAGATVIGPAPERTPALQDDPAAFGALVARLWSGQPVGRGRVIASRNVEAALAGAGIGADFHVTGSTAADAYRFVHRTWPGGDLYFVTNGRAQAEQVRMHLRVTGRQPEIWRAIDASVAPLSYRTEGEDTVIALDVGPEDAFFILLRKPAPAPTRTVAPVTLKTLATLSRPWTVRFQPGRGAPAEIALPTLVPLDQSRDPGVRYFSGEATYSSHFALPREARPGAPLWLDLGTVGDLAEVRVNGRLAGTCWFAPHRLDIGKLVQRGRNQIEVKVADLWVNRLIGDQQPGADRVAFTTVPTYRPAAPLRRSGLIGPVTLSVERRGTGEPDRNGL